MRGLKKQMIRYTVNKDEHQLILETLEVYIKICADQQKKDFAKEILEDLRDVKKQYAIEDNAEPSVCD